MIGFLAALALFFPWLGGGFEAFIGVHPRIVSYVATLVIVFLRFRFPATTLQPSMRAALASISVAVLFATAILLFPWNSQFWFLSSEYSSHDFPGYKMTRTLLSAAPMIVAGAFFARYANSPQFLSGLIFGSLFTGLCGAIHVLEFRHLITSDWQSFNESAAFSTISMSFIFNFAIVGAISKMTECRTPLSTMAYLIIIGCSLLVIFLLAQRSSMGLGLMTILLFVYRQFKSGLAAAGLFAIFIAPVLEHALAVASSYGRLGHQFGRFESLVVSVDDVTQGRLEMLTFCFRGFRENPMGHGFGAFCEAYPDMEYPHNLIAEAGYELGLVGGLCACLLVLLAAQVLWSLFVSGRNDLVCMGLLITTAYIMKAGNISALGTWVPWIYLGCVAICRQRTVHRVMEAKHG